jgi:hypothetical protein
MAAPAAPKRRSRKPRRPSPLDKRIIALEARVCTLEDELEDARHHAAEVDEHLEDIGADVAGLLRELDHRLSLRDWPLALRLDVERLCGALGIVRPW